MIEIKELRDKPEWATLSYEVSVDRLPAFTLHVERKVLVDEVYYLGLEPGTFLPSFRSSQFKELYRAFKKAFQNTTVLAKTELHNRKARKFCQFFGLAFVESDETYAYYGAQIK